MTEDWKERKIERKKDRMIGRRQKEKRKLEREKIIKS